MQPPSARQEWRAHWPIALAGMFGYSMVAIPTIVLGLVMQPLEAEFGWSRSLVSLSLTVVAVITTPLSPVAGSLADRFGARNVAVPGLFLNALALAGLALMTGAAWLWLFAWAVYAFTQLAIRSMIFTSAISGAFTASRGLAIAVVLGGVAVVQTFLPRVTQWITDDYGWRSAFVAIGLGWGGIAFLLCLLFFRDLRQRGPAKPGDTVVPAAGGLTPRQALRDSRLLRVAFAIILQSAMVGAYSVHIVPLLGELSLSRAQAATISGLGGFAGLAGQLVTGALADRARGSWLPVLCFLLPGLGYVLLWYTGGSLWMVSIGVLIGGYAAGAAMNISIYLASRYAGVRHFGTVFGLISAGMGLTAGLSPFLLARLYDTTGSYAHFIALAVVSAGLAAIAVFRLGPYPDFAPVQQEESEGLQQRPASA